MIFTGGFRDFQTRKGCRILGTPQSRGGMETAGKRGKRGEHCGGKARIYPAVPLDNITYGNLHFFPVHVYVYSPYVFSSRSFSTTWRAEAQDPATGPVDAVRAGSLETSSTEPVFCLGIRSPWPGVQHYGRQLSGTAGGYGFSTGKTEFQTPGYPRRQW